MDWGDVLFYVLLGGTGALFPYVAERIQRRRLRRQAGAGRTTVAVRTVSGQHRDLSSRWQRRRAVPSAGQLDLARWLVGGWDHLVLDVVAVRPGHRSLRLRESLTVEDALDHVLTVQTSTGEVELAVGPEQADWIRAQLSEVTASEGS